MNQMAMNGGNMPNGVPGGMVGMNNNAHGQTPNPQTDDNDYKTKLNTYIYDYLLRNEQWDCARAIANSGLKVHTKKKDNNAMDTDTKDEFGKKPNDLDLPANIFEATTENSFLLDWFTLFWEIFLAPRTKRPPTLNPHAVSYASHIRDQSKIRQEAQSQFLRQPGIPTNMQQQYNMMRMPNGAMAGRMPQGMANAQGLTPQQQMLAQRQRAIMQQQSMERGGSDMEMNGQRPRTPSAAMMPGMEGPLPDFYANGAMRPGMPQNPGAAGGNHALQDYQMQLMLLEQQNKKRLLMARQEQDSMRPDGANMGGQQAFTAPGMSPQGSRSGPSPNPSDQMKRGTPKLNQAGLPGSPMPDGTMQRGSPGAMNFNNGNVPMEMMQPTMNGKMGEMPMGPNGAQMRPPSSHPQYASQMQQMAQIRQAQANGQIPNGANWQQGPQGPGMMNPQAGQMQQQPGQPGQPQQPPQQGQQQGQQQPNQQGQMGTPQPRSMPPPAGPAANAVNAANARPASPAQSAASTTPQQTNKANPKKKDTKETRKRPNKKNNAAAATPSADGENPPPTPTAGQTPITPMNASFEKQKGGQQPNSTTGAPAPVAAPAQPVAPPQPDPNMMPQFNDMDGNIGSDVNMDFGDMDAGDVLNTFDFDAFLQDDNNTAEFDIGSFDYQGLEAGGES